VGGEKLHGTAKRGETTNSRSLKNNDLLSRGKETGRRFFLINVGKNLGLSRKTRGQTQRVDLGEKGVSGKTKGTQKKILQSMQKAVGGKVKRLGKLSLGRREPQNGKMARKVKRTWWPRTNFLGNKPTNRKKNVKTIFQMNFMRTNL